MRDGLMLLPMWCQVRGAAAVTAAREGRALAALEKSVAERNAAAAAREQMLLERESAVRWLWRPRSPQNRLIVPCFSLTSCHLLAMERRVQLVLRDRAMLG
jgi:hypothetical protein